jgi:hypothetical protein
MNRDQLRSIPNTIGRQDVITGNGDSNGSSFDAPGPATALAAQSASTTRRFRIRVAGSRKVTVTVKPTVTGTGQTARIYSTLADGITENTAKAATSLTLTNNTITEASRTLDGESFVVLEVVTVATNTVAFQNAEYRCEPA